MNSLSGPKFAIEIHPSNWRFPTEKSWIAGWITPAADQTITDVRARLHHRIILGLVGMPHPVSAENSTATPFAPDSGFSFLFSPQSDASLLQLEYRDQTGRWLEFFRTNISPAPHAPVLTPIPGLSQSLRLLTTLLLKNHLLTPKRSWTSVAHDLIAAHVAEPLNAQPNPPFIGSLEEPRDTGRLRYGRISVTGWLTHTTARITRLSVVINPLPGITLPHGLARADIIGAFPALTGHTDYAFVGEVVLPPDLASPVLLKIFAELDNGEQHLAFARRFTLLNHGNFSEIPPLGSGLNFTRAVWALFRAAGRYALPQRGLVQTLRTAWAGYQTMPSYRRPNALPPKKTISRHPDFEKASRVAPSVAESTHAPHSVHAVHALPACTHIGATDDMHVLNLTQYFQVGREALALIQAAVAAARCGPITAILDLPCGHGRVARWLQTAYPAANLFVCDTQQAGVDFCVEQLGAIGVPATVDGRHWAVLPGPYDIIWCGSLLTHFDTDEWSNHLHRFAERLSSRGVLVFTSHGLPALERLQTGDKDYGLPPLAVEQLLHATVTTGFGYAAYADTPAYGISIVQPGWLRAFLAAETDLQILSYRPSAWDQHQDVIVCTRRTP